MLTRIITAIFLIIAALLWLFVADYAIFTMGALFIYMVSAYEMGPLIGFKSKIPFVVIALALATLIFYFFPPGLYIEMGVPEEIKYLVLLSIPYWLSISPIILLYPRTKMVLANKFIASLSAILMLLPFLFTLLILRAENYGQDKNTGAFLVLAVMALVWLCDSAAYFTGKAFGKHKLIPQVSPKKTWEGVFGGVIFAMIGFFVFNYYGLYASFASHLNTLIIAAFIAIVMSIIGDLGESMYKRNANIKDSGKIFPGHGGMLDRVDAQLSALPLFLAINYISVGIW